MLDDGDGDQSQAHAPASRLMDVETKKKWVEREEDGCQPRRQDAVARGVAPGQVVEGGDAGQAVDDHGMRTQCVASPERGGGAS